MSIESRLFIEKNPKTDEYQVKIVVGLFNDKQDALNHASYIAITKSIDFSTEQLIDSLTDIEEFIRPINTTLH
jgi:hypothetical protein|tara:strand:+ start:107 stop:325 length:219 start_codon:yes stop_codon:yes gene_type:complete